MSKIDSVTERLTLCKNSAIENQADEVVVKTSDVDVVLQLFEAFKILAIEFANYSEGRYHVCGLCRFEQECRGCMEHEKWVPNYEVILTKMKAGDLR